MASEFKNNHYVPIWYQKRFLPFGQRDQELYYLNLRPSNFVDSKGTVHTDRSIHQQGFRKCFVEKDLYTMNFGSMENKVIEQIFFGDIDNYGQHGVDYFTKFKHPDVNGNAFESLIMYMSTQKLRTPKGLDWLSNKANTKNKNSVLRLMIKLMQLYCAIWTECIWLIADASKSNTKFIISDHPITVYNRVCGPRSMRCRGSNDPDIWLNGTHTLFPLSLDKILIMTNLSWVRNPYQSEIKNRPNPSPLRNAIFKFQDIQTLRHLSEQEVCDINYIIKRRAFRYIAAAREEWLFPENYISTKKWNEYGSGYLFMPDPRAIHLGGELYIGHNDGTSSAYDAYGRTPWQSDYRKESNDEIEFNSLYRFKGEFARLFGPFRRGRAYSASQLDKERDDDEFHNYHLSLENKNKRKKMKL